MRQIVALANYLSDNDPDAFDRMNAKAQELGNEYQAVQQRFFSRAIITLKTMIIMPDNSPWFGDSGL